MVVFSKEEMKTILKWYLVYAGWQQPSDLDEKLSMVIEKIINEFYEE
jgi:hypothetical protein